MVELFHEKIPVFRFPNRLDRGSKHASTVMLENLIIVKRQTALKGCLSAKTEQHAVRSFLLDHPFYKICGNRQKIYLIRQIIGCLNRCDVRIDQNRLDFLFLHSLDGLAAGVVEFAGLTDFKGPAAEDEDF